MTKRQLRILAGSVGSLLFLVTGVLAASLAGFKLDWHTISGGGGRASSSSYGLEGSIAQVAVGPASSAGYNVGAGFWYAAVETVPPAPTPTRTLPPTPTRTPQPTPTGTPSCPPGTKLIQREAEDAQLQSPMTIAQGSSASNCEYIRSSTRDQGLATFLFNIPECGTYNLWARGKGVGWTNNSFWWSVDDGEWIWWEIEQINGNWGWLWADLGTVELASGAHTLKFKCREDLARLDRIELSGDPFHVPTVIACGTPIPTPEARPVNLPCILKRYPAYFDDTFADSSLDSRWTWINEDPSMWSLTAVPGSLRLRSHNGRVYEKNLLVQTAPGGDFKVSTRVLFEPTSNYQIAGIVLYQDDQNLIVLGRAYCDEAFCVGNGIYWDWVEDGSPGGSASMLATTDKSSAYLRVIREGATYSGYYSEDASNWTLVGTYTPGGAVTLSRVGLGVGQDLADIRIPVDFRYINVRPMD